MVTRDKIIEEKMLRLWLSANVDTLFEANKKHGRFIDDPIKRHLFFNNNSRVLAVCHLDTVQKPLAFDAIGVTKDRIDATGLDDRLGGYILSRLSKWGVKCDLLMCDLEESGRSTAKYFETTKEYDWVVEFDRKGCDIAQYGEMSQDFRSYVKNIGGGVNRGSMTDLCYLELPNDPIMFNMGIGYEDAHGAKSWANIDALHYNMVRFQLIYDKFYGTPMPADEVKVATYGHGSRNSYGGWYGSGQGVGNNKNKSKVTVPTVKGKTTKPPVGQTCANCFLFTEGSIKGAGYCYKNPSKQVEVIQYASTTWCARWEDETYDVTNDVSDTCIACEGYGWTTSGQKCPICAGRGSLPADKINQLEAHELEKGDAEDEPRAGSELTPEELEALVPWEEEAILKSYLDGETLCPECSMVVTTDAVWHCGNCCPMCDFPVDEVELTLKEKQESLDNNTPTLEEANEAVDRYNESVEGETTEIQERCTNCAYLYVDDETAKGNAEMLYECGVDNAPDHKPMTAKKCRKHSCKEWASNFVAEVVK